MKSAFRKLAFLAFGLVLLGSARPASANFAGTLVVNDLGITSGTLGGSSFTFQSLFTGVGTTTGTSGGFDVPGEQFQSIGSATLTLGSLPSLVFGNSIVGTFTGEQTTITSMSPTSETIYILGTYTTGTAIGGTATAYEASYQVTISMNNGQLGATGVLSVPPAMVPEPSSVSMVVLGLGGVAWTRRRRVRPT